MSRTSPGELLIRQRIKAVTRSLSGAQDGDVRCLHEARVATRRLREALPIIAAGARGRKLQRMARRLTRALGPVRELDVALITLDELDASGEMPAAAIRKLKQVVRTERERLHVEMRRRVSRVDLDALEKRAAHAARKQSKRSMERDPVRLGDARQRAATRGLALRAAIENAAGIYLPDRLHEVRIAVKKLRYALELTRELSGSRATARIRVLKEAQDLLGRMHDLEVLIARVRAVQGSPGAPDLRVSAELDRVVRRLETECRQLHGNYMTARKKLLAICDQAATDTGEGAPPQKRRGRTPRRIPSAA